MKIVLTALLAFALSIGVAVVLYPGGTWFARDTAGYSFWHNYWCDLLSPVALNGQPNLGGSLLARLSFMCFALALASFWPMALALTDTERRDLLASRAGQAGALGLVLTALLPSTSTPLLHGIAVVFAALASVLAAFLFSRSQRKRGERVGAALGAIAGLVALAAVALYVYQGTFGHDVPFLPAVQKATTFLLLSWMARVLWISSQVRQG